METTWSRDAVLRKYAGRGFLPIMGGEGETTPDPNPGGTTPDPATATTPDPAATTPEPEKVGTLTEAQQRAVDKLVSDARLEGRRAAERAAEDAKKKLEDARAQSELEAKGEYETAKAALQSQLDTAAADLATATAKIAEYEIIAKAEVASLKESLPPEALDAFPDAADPLAQMAWLKDRAALVAKLRPGGKGNGATAPLPKTPGGDPNAQDLGDEKFKLASAVRTIRNF